MNFEVQVRGKFEDNDEDIYFNPKYDLYFYKTQVSEEHNDKNTITCQLQYLKDNEVKELCVENGKKFKLFSKIDGMVKELHFDVDTTNIILPIQLLEKRLEMVQELLGKATTFDVNDISNDIFEGQSNNIFDETKFISENLESLNFDFGNHSPSSHSSSQSDDNKYDLQP